MAANDKIIVKTLIAKGDPKEYNEVCCEAIMGIQDAKFNKTLYSGSMTGCHLLIAISKKDPHGSFILHDNVTRQDYCQQIKTDYTGDEYDFHLFFTKKSMSETGQTTLSLEEFVSNRQTEYSQAFSTAFYVDDSRLDRVEVKYIPKTGQLIVYGILEFFQKGKLNCTVLEFQGKIPLPEIKKDPSLLSLQQYIAEQFKYEGYTPAIYAPGKLPSGVEELCNALTLEDMKRIAERKQKEKSSYRTPKTQRLYEIVATKKYITPYSIKNEIKVQIAGRSAHANSNPENSDGQCCIM